MIYSLTKNKNTFSDISYFLMAYLESEKGLI